MRHFTADLHLDHEGVLEMSGRLFRNIYEHDMAMISIINRRVSVNDTLYVLGDVGWNSIDNYMDQILCKNIHLIWGNHDKNNFGKKFKTHQDVLEIKIGQKPNQHKLFMSHYAHAYWPSSHYGAFHIYGHTHRQREATLDVAFPGRRSIDVGVDNALHLLGEYRPFTEDELIAILGSKPGHDPVQFYTDFQGKLMKYRSCVPVTRPDCSLPADIAEKMKSVYYNPNHKPDPNTVFQQEHQNEPYTPGGEYQQMDRGKRRIEPPNLLEFGGQDRES
jgi:calcineurin-like phosphoesterase family protein